LPPIYAQLQPLKLTLCPPVFDSDIAMLDICDQLTEPHADIGLRYPRNPLKAIVAPRPIGWITSGAVEAGAPAACCCIALCTRMQAIADH
jgi:hypothetical protein